MRRGGKALLFALVLSTGSVAGAQEQEEELPPSGDRAATKYQGVAPGAGAAEQRKPLRGKTPLVTWLGFQPTHGGRARVFVQLDRDVPHPQEVRAGTLVVSLEGARVARPSTGRFLDTRFFDTSVQRVQIEKVALPGASARRSGPRGLALVIHFKNAGDARQVPTEMTVDKDGYTYLMVDVPAAGTAISSAARPGQR